MEEQTHKMQRLLVKKFFENLNALAVKKYLNFQLYSSPPPHFESWHFVSWREEGGGGGVKEHRGGDNGRLLLI